MDEFGQTSITYTLDDLKGLEAIWVANGKSVQGTLTVALDDPRLWPMLTTEDRLLFIAQWIDEFLKGNTAENIFQRRAAPSA